MKKLLATLLTLCFCLLPMGVAGAEGADIYVLMNIPYADFYAAEANAAPVDAVSSSTLMKTRSGDLAGGTYHIDPEGSDISGVIFPVKVSAADAAQLSSLGGVEITDESRVEITISLKGEETTTVYEGADALFEAPDYSWYVLDEAPEQYKALTLGDAAAFGAVEGPSPIAVDGNAYFSYDKHADYVIHLAGLDEALAGAQIRAAVLVADDGTSVGLQQVANLWRGKQIGFNRDSAVYQALAGKTITEIRFISLQGTYSLPTRLYVTDDALLAGLAGTYIELFPEFAKEEYKEFWYECIQAHGVDDATADMYYQMLTLMFMGRLYGQDAIDAYSADPESMVFDCYFENGLAKLTVDGRTISGVDADGAELFRHDYAYVSDETVSYFGEEMPVALHVYQTEDADAGLFTYFAFSDDIPGETQHIEYRYAASLENIANYTEGDCAYWMASGILDGYKDSMIQNCIKLFVDENVGEEAGAEADDAPIEIATAEDLAAINDNLSGNYLLVADIDLAGVEWTPIGAYAPSGESEEEQEIPSTDYAFTGTFNGGDHVITNLTIHQPEGWALGLFGCAANAEISNFTLENATVDGALMAADVVGYAYCTTVKDVWLWGGKVTAHESEMGAEGMYGGIVGAGMGSLIVDCSAEADIVLPGNTANAGIVGGGLELTSVTGSIATGTITAGDNCYGLGGVSGCGFGAEQFTNNRAEDVTITTGDGCFWIGGITGYAGGFEMAEMGVPVTAVSGCTAQNVTITTGEGADGLAAIVGAGFYNEEVAAAYGAPFDQPTVFTVEDCTVEAVTINGEAAE